jgi:phosphate transport system protein
LNRILPVTLRHHFQERLEEIRSDVIRMGGDANEMVRLAVESTLNGDLELANRVIAADDRVDDFERAVVNKTVIAVMQESPVAADLRFLVSTLGVVSEIEKVGDDAVKLARRATKLSGQFPPEMRVALLELGEAARRSFNSSIRLFSDYSTELSVEIVRGDKEIDTAYSQARNKVFNLIQQNPEATEHLVRTIEAFHALEHVADHAVAIAVRLRMVYEAEHTQI